MCGMRIDLRRSMAASRAAQALLASRPLLPAAAPRGQLHPLISTIHVSPQRGPKVKGKCSEEGRVRANGEFRGRSGAYIPYLSASSHVHYPGHFSETSRLAGQSMAAASFCSEARLFSWQCSRRAGGVRWANG